MLDEVYVFETVALSMALPYLNYYLFYIGHCNPLFTYHFLNFGFQFYSLCYIDAYDWSVDASYNYLQVIPIA